jgi:hydrogenase maturation protease
VLEDSDRVIFVDAILAGGRAGEIAVLERERLPIYFTRALSPHQTDLRDVLAAAELRGTIPSECVAIGVEPELVELGTELTPVVQRSIEPLVAAVVARLRAWGHECAPRVASTVCTR